MVELKYKENNGVKYWQYYGKNNYESLMAAGNKRIVLNGNLGVTLMKDSWKFGNQLQFNIFSQKDKEVIIQDRNKSDWNRCEIYLNVDELDNLLEVLKNFKRIMEDEKNEG